MNFEEASYGQGTPFDSYGPGFFRLGGRIHEGDLVVAPGGVRLWGGMADTATLLALKGDIDLVLLGTGETMVPVPGTLREPLEAAGIGIEPMSTPSACRSYNVLLGEGRRLAAAVLAL
ncbi:MAG: Mth938-like domain-containing protein [Tropicimonas sp.]|uniref:Mth938-like domain-containing protein n=1 Tax=Tropicimonas sp. TaxID=2067044 RepID=UPI003A858594